MDKKYKILIVEDKEIDVFYKILLDYELTVVDNGKSAIEEVKNKSFDLILLDIGLEGNMDGIKVCLEIRKELKGIPIIFVTGSKADKKLKEAFEAGGDDYIHKPFGEIELIERIKIHIEKSEQKRQLQEKNKELEEKYNIEKQNEELKILKEQLNIQLSGTVEELEESEEKLEETKEELKEKIKELEESIDAASSIQNAILPNNKILKEYFLESFVLYQPKQNVGGDFYYWKAVKDGILLIVGDCVGHGVAASLYSTLSMRLIEETCSLVREDPLMILNTLNYSLSKYYGQIHNSIGGMELAICKIDFEKKKIEIASSSRPVIHVSDRTVRECGDPAVAIGKDFPNPQKTFKKLEIYDYKNGDCLFFFSDGFQDQEGKSNEKFTYPKFKSLLEKIAKSDKFEEGDKTLKRQLTKWQGKNEQTDDILIIGIKIP